jgi:hypothetical protein
MPQLYVWQEEQRQGCKDKIGDCAQRRLGVYRRPRNLDPALATTREFWEVGSIPEQRDWLAAEDQNEDHGKVVEDVEPGKYVNHPSLPVSNDVSHEMLAGGDAESDGTKDVEDVAEKPSL